MPRPRRALYAAFDTPTELARRRVEAVLRADGFLKLLPHLMWRPLTVESARPSRRLSAALRRRQSDAAAVVMFFLGLSPREMDCRWILRRGERA
jgi:hypothetical protein